MKRRATFAILATLAVFLSACGINSIPTAEEQAKAKWADVQAAYQRRLDVLPSVARAAVAAGGHERELQQGVAEARSGVARAQVGADQLTDPAALQRFAQAQQGVSAMFLRATVEATPENRASATWQTLMSEIEGSNNRITIAIRDYNEAVRAYNTRIRTFPSVVGARVIYGSQPMVPFEATSGANVAPDLDLGAGTGPGR